MLRRINLYGGPGSGKSTVAAGVFSRLKDQMVTCEWVQEPIKVDAYRKIPAVGYDQFLLFAKQMSMEDTLLRNGVDIVINDAPLLMNLFYTQKSGAKYVTDLLDMAGDFEQLYPGVHIFIERGDRPYNEKGRYQNKEQARLLDAEIVEFVTPYLVRSSLHRASSVASAIDSASLLVLDGMKLSVKLDLDSGLNTKNPQSCSHVINPLSGCCLRCGYDERTLRIRNRF